MRRLLVRSAPDESSDAALLDRFVAAQDERAFATLVDRHGPLVLRVCQRVLGNVPDAEDAFQAAFLILARKAARVHPREALPAWLHGVARRVALKAHAARTRQLRAARSLTALPADPRPDPLAAMSARELLRIVDEEVQRLPEVYRLPVILCCLEGHSLEEAARQLGWTPGSVKGRLERGRGRLRARLVRRGLTLAAALAAAELARCAASAAVVARLVARTVRGALAFGARRTVVAEGVSAGATALARQTLRGMALAPVKAAAVLVLALKLLATGFLLHRTAEVPSARIPEVWSSPFPPMDQPALVAPAVFGRNPQTQPRAAAYDRVEVRGRVLDPKGQPLAGARLYVGYSVRRRVADVPSRGTAYPLRATSRADGRFQFTFARSELDPRWLDDSRPAVVAVASGYGPDWAEIREPGLVSELSLGLVEDLPVTGRILDPNRQPVVGSRILVREVVSDSPAGVTGYLRGDAASWYPRRWRGPLPEQPSSVRTDADGRFRLVGLGRDRLVSLTLDGAAIQHTSLTAVTRLAPANANAWRVHGATFEYVAAPSRSIRGVVRDKRTCRPVAGVRLCAVKDHPPAFTDADGRFEMVGCPRMPQGYVVTAQPPTGAPYFAATIGVADAPGLEPLVVAIDLESGISLSGRVTDQGTGLPPRAAVVEYHPLHPNAHSSRLALCPGQPASAALVRPDGSYSLVVLPGPGVVCVAASPRDTYATATIDDQTTANWFPDRIKRGGNQNLYAAVGAGRPGLVPVNKYSALSPVDPEEQAESVVLDLTLQPAHTLHGTVSGPDGKPVSGAVASGLTALPDDEMLDGASFTVTGLNPRGTRPLSFCHPGKGLGKALTVRGDDTGPLRVQLEPCGSVHGRLVDSGGNPVPGVTVRLGGASGFVVTAESDRAGCFRGALLPGQKYSLWLSGSRRLTQGVGRVEVGPGRSKDLGDLRLAD
jgi:RNA polymerase sigma factor (sigma-70 family)